MTKYLILFTAPVQMDSFMAQNSPEQREAGRQAWIDWKARADEAGVTFDFGGVVKPEDRVTAIGVEPSKLEVTNYATAEADNKDALVEVLKSHPHMDRPGAAIEVLVELSMPGM